MVFDKLVDAALRHNHGTLSAPAKANVASRAPSVCGAHRKTDLCLRVI